MPKAPLNILIIGGGIAGCCAAIALTQTGHRVRIVEKQDAWRFQSSGIFVYANGLVSLGKLGLLEEMLAAGFAGFATMAGFSSAGTSDAASSFGASAAALTLLTDLTSINTTQAMIRKLMTAMMKEP